MHLKGKVIQWSPSERVDVRCLRRVFSLLMTSIQLNIVTYSSTIYQFIKHLFWVRHTAQGFTVSTLKVFTVKYRKTPLKSKIITEGDSYTVEVHIKHKNSTEEGVISSIGGSEMPFRRDNILIDIGQINFSSLCMIKWDRYFPFYRQLP